MLVKEIVVVVGVIMFGVVVIEVVLEVVEVSDKVTEETVAVMNVVMTAVAHESVGLRFLVCMIVTVALVAVHVDVEIVFVQVGVVAAVSVCLDLVDVLEFVVVSE